MRPTIKDVARRAGVSATTVSMVLNDPNNSISERTRKSVKQAVFELGYRPNRLAVSLVTKKTNIIGLIFPVDINTFQTAFLNQIEESATAYGYTIIFGTANDSVDRTVHHLMDFADRGVDGIILAQSVFRDPGDTEACLNAIAALSIPIVLADRVPEDSSEDMVTINDFRGGYDATKHLLYLGHRKIGIITGPMHIINCVKRLKGCEKALEEVGVPLDESFVFEGDFGMAGGMKALPYLLGKNVTAIFAFNDLTAYGVYKELRNYDMQIPDDLSIIGFDDVYFSDIIHPPLTTMEFPLKEMAAAAVDRLILRINGLGQAPSSLVFDPVIKVKGSTRRLVGKDIIRLQ